MFWCSLVELDAILTLIFLIVYGLGSLRNITGSSFDINFFSRLFPVLFLIGFLLEANSFSSLLEQELSSLLGPQSMGSMIEWALVALTIVILYNFRSLESLLLLLFAFLGQYFLLHSVDFLSFFIALEVQNFCFFVLCGLCSSKSEVKSKSFSVEGALKYFLLSAFSSGVMLFWFSAIYLQTGQSSFLAITPFHDSSFSSLGAPCLESFAFQAWGPHFYTFMIVGALMFKLGAAPLHLWVTQIYGNVTRSLLLFVSTAPKLAFFGFWLNAFHGFYYSSSHFSTRSGLWSGGSQQAGPLACKEGAPGMAPAIPRGELSWSGRSHTDWPWPDCLPTGQSPVERLQGGPNLFLGRQYGSSLTYGSVLFFAAFSLILGAFAAYSQPALRSLFAYSTINEVGLLLSAVETAGWNTLFQHLGIYLISQVLLWNCFHRKFLALLAVSFAGLPPLAGFFGKAWILWHISSVGFYSILALALFCTCVSLVYYLRIIRLFYENPTPSLYVKYSGTVIGKDTLSLLSDGLTREKVVATCLILLFTSPFFLLKPSFVL